MNISGYSAPMIRMFLVKSPTSALMEYFSPLLKVSSIAEKNCLKLQGKKQTFICSTTFKKKQLMNILYTRPLHYTVNQLNE